MKVILFEINYYIMDQEEKQRMKFRIILKWYDFLKPQTPKGA
jgi:hypothetical protein